MTTNGAGGPWQSEVAWTGSSGGISTNFAIPSYQSGVANSSNHGSTTMRNMPDVSIIADIQIYLVFNNGQTTAVGGTSAAAPLWAGFTALANQQAVANGHATAGFINPTVYSIGKGSGYTTDFHDITSGNNYNSSSPNLFPAASGYDLVTGWGSPTGQAMINALSGGGTTGTGVVFYQNTNYGGTATSAIPAGSYTLSQLQAYGFVNDWASSVQIPSGWTVVMYSDDNFSGTSWTLTTNTPNFTTLSPSANDVVTSCKITSAATGDFSLSASPSSLSVSQSNSGTSTITVNKLNGFSGSVSLSASGLPSGVTASFNPSTTTGTSTLTLTASSTAATGTSTVTVTGTSGSLTHTTTISLTVTGGVAGNTPVNMSSAYNVYGIYTDGTSFSTGGLDGTGSAYSANLLGSSVTWSSTTFNIGPSNALDAVDNATITLPSGQFTGLKMLATGVNGNQTSQTFTVTYTDNTTLTFTQSISDWFSPQSNYGEATAVTMAYRNSSGGTKDNRTFLLYGYSFSLNSSKTVKSITLPGNRNVVVIAMTLTGGTSTGGVVFYQDVNYGGTATQAIPVGSYTLSQLQPYGFSSGWASSVKIPAGWSITMYSGDNFFRNFVDA